VGLELFSCFLGVLMDDYTTGVVIVGGITFVLAWIYCMATYGFLFGFGLGWLPAAILGVIVGFLWPLVVLALCCLILLIAYQAK
jgi:hypothetical protein